MLGITTSPPKYQTTHPGGGIEHPKLATPIVILSLDQVVEVADLKRRQGRNSNFYYLVDEPKKLMKVGQGTRERAPISI